MDTLLYHLELLLEPMGLLWLGLLLLTFSAWRRKQRGLAAGSAALALLLFLVGSTGLPSALVRGLEQPYAGVDFRTVPPADAVVMLGGGIEPARLEAPGFHLNRAGDRVLMAVELMRLHKAPVLVLGGGTGTVAGQRRVEADLLKDWIEQAQLARGAEVISLGACANTHSEAERVRALVEQRGWKDVLLVTSASHMRRATATFTTAGVPIRPVPCNFMTRLSTSEAEHISLVPTWTGLEKISVWLHEIGGWYEYRRRGWIRTAPTVPDR